MSIKSKLLDKTSDLQIPVDPAPSGDTARPAPAVTAASPDSTRFPAVTPGATSRTGPGQMLQFRGQMLAAEGEMSKLRDRLKEHEGSTPTRKIDPALIKPSQWANRHPDAFKSAGFERLKQDIAIAGGNVQPILVRPIANEAGHYEVVFGHRRHKACLELGIPVLTTIETAAISDLDLFSAMDRENRERADLSPYEQGVMYRHALDAGLYPSNRRLAEALGVSHTWVANVLSVADLPSLVLECFRSPLEVQHRHAKEIAASIEQDRKGLLRRAERLRQTEVKLAPGAVVAALTKARPEAPGAPNAIAVAGQNVGTWQRDRAGRLVIQLDAQAVPEKRLEAVLAKILEALS